MNNFFYVLNFTDKVIIDGANISSRYSHTWQTIKVDPYQYLTNSAINFVQKLELNLLPYANFFIGQANSVSDIHIDINSDFALNYVWGADDSTMHWFEIINNKKQLAFTSAGTPYLRYSNDQVNELAVANLSNNLFFARVNVPHQVKNNSSSLRYCLSLRFKPSLSWDQISTRYNVFLK